MIGPRILAIESSCDETGVAVVVGGRRIEASQVASQVALHAETGGNPFFVRELVRHLAESAGPGPGRELRLDRLGLPRSVREVITRRLARLSPAANQALVVAAVLGPTFSLPALEKPASATLT